MLTTMGNAGVEFPQGIRVYTEEIQARSEIPLYSFEGDHPISMIERGTPMTVYRRNQLVMTIVLNGELVEDVSMSYIFVQIVDGVNTYGYVPTDFL